MTYPELSMLVSGRQVREDEGNLDIVNPANEAVIGHIPLAGEKLVLQAVGASDRGFDKWRRATPRERANALLRAGDILEGRIDEISLALTLEHGKPLHEAKAEWTATIDVIRWFGEEARRIYGRVIPTGGASRHLLLSEPVGPVAAFTPWNVPALAAGRKVAPALAAGCSVILKGASETPSAAYAIISAMHEAGVPQEAAQLVFGKPAQVSELLIGSAAIRKVSFTGSTRVGRIIAGLAAQGLKRSTLELGGHAPVLIFPDVDVELAAREAVAWKYRNAGQVCASPTRFMVHEAIVEEFTGRFVKHASNIRIGDGTDPNTDMGPLITRQRQSAVDGLVTDALDKGAELLAGGPSPRSKGYFYEPTVLGNVTKDAAIMRDEPFGPVAPITSFSSYEEAITEANDVPVGLAAFVMTESSSIARAAASDLRAGIVGVNDYNCSRCEIPFGGVKDTGWGQEGGAEGIEPYLVKKSVLNA